MAQDRASISSKQLEKAMAGLSAAEREVLELSAREGLRNEALAAHLGLSLEAVERLLADALFNLDRALERQKRPWWRFW